MEFLKYILQKILKYILARKKTNLIEIHQKGLNKSVFQENILLGLGFPGRSTHLGLG